MSGFLAAALQMTSTPDPDANLAAAEELIELATRRGAWKLVVNGRLHDRSPEGNKPLTDENSLWLSNVEEDPGESRNLRRLHPNIVDDLLTQLNRWSETLPKGGA